ncbi:hypothetical protein R3P38DRAFT_3351404 [Favolaschia claudopus]|uniref:Uncharacterized protein n=1 Tax=Favolaschia claudopus TaxID=2862362 RepID=A0AAW0C9E9_9AGAR
MSNASDCIKIVYPNSCCDPVALAEFKKNYEDGPERFQNNDELRLAGFAPGFRELHDSIRSRIRVRPFNSAPEMVDFINHRTSGSSDSGLSDSSDELNPILPTSRPSLALTPTYDKENPEVAMTSIIKDPTLQLIYRGVLGPNLVDTPAINFLDYEVVYLTDKAVHLQLRKAGDASSDAPSQQTTTTAVIYGTSSWSVKSAFHRLVFERLERIAHILHCAANQHNRVTDGPYTLPSIYIEALRENGSPMSGISLFKSHDIPSSDDLDARSWNNPADAVKYIEGLQEMISYYEHQMLDTMQNTTLTNGLDSQWSFGSAFGVPDKEFDERLRPSFQYSGGNPSLRRLLNDPVKANEMDFRCATALNPAAERILVFKSHGFFTSVIWPMTPPPAIEWEDDDGPVLMRRFLEQHGLTEDWLNDRVRAEGDGTGKWCDADW